MRTGVLVVLAVAVGLSFLVPISSAQPVACEAVLANGNDTTSGPGGQLADAIGDQREELGSVLNETLFDARLANATSDRERGQLVAAQIERSEEHLAALDECWQAHGTDRETDDGTTGLTADQVDSLEGQLSSLHNRLNVTADAATRLPSSIREEYGIHDERFAELTEEIRTLNRSLARSAEGAATPES